MAPPRRDEDETNDIIDRRSTDGLMIRYDQARNLLGVLDLNTGAIVTFFRPGFTEEKTFSDKLEPREAGTQVFREFVTRPPKRAIRSGIQHN